MKVANISEDVWNLPHCVGAIDNKHVVLQSPISFGSESFNYKLQFSIVLMAVVDARSSELYKMMTKKLNYRVKAETIPWKNRCASKVFINPRTMLVSVLQKNRKISFPNHQNKNKITKMTFQCNYIKINVKLYE
jgi:hypothetical protein